MIYERGGLEPVPGDRGPRDVSCSAQDDESCGLRRRYEDVELRAAGVPEAVTIPSAGHTTSIWGFGLGASSFVDGAGLKNHDKMYDYIRDLNQNKAPVDEESTEVYKPREENGGVRVRRTAKSRRDKSLKNFRQNIPRGFLRHL